MTSRLLFGGIAWLAALLLLAAAFESSLRARGVSYAQPASALARHLNNGDAVKAPPKMKRARRGSWKVTRASSTFHFMSIDVEAERIDDALAIATEIVAPIEGRFDEILIYVRKVGANEREAARRIQWTRGAGFAPVLVLR